MMKLLVNQAYEQMGLSTTQLVGTLLDGAARHTPEGLAFTRRRGGRRAHRGGRARRPVRRLRAGAAVRRARRAALAAALPPAAATADRRGAGPHDARRVRQGDRVEGLPGAVRPHLRAEAREQLEQVGLPCEVAMQRGLGDVKNPRLTIGKITVARTTRAPRPRSGARPRARRPRRTPSSSSPSRTAGASPRSADFGGIPAPRSGSPTAVRRRRGARDHAATILPRSTNANQDDPAGGVCRGADRARGIAGRHARHGRRHARLPRRGREGNSLLLSTYEDWDTGKTFLRFSDSGVDRC